MIERHQTDILILGSGGAGLFAALHAHQVNPNLDITVASKGFLCKSGCTRMVQAATALHKGDPIERHYGHHRRRQMAAETRNSPGRWW
ncbi:MAG: FAD-binding protein [Hyphomicrobiaceae bacterium]